MKVGTFGLNTALGNQDLTIGGFTDTPVACIALVSSENDLDSIEDNISFTIAFATPTEQCYTLSASINNRTTSSNTYQRSSTTSFLASYHPRVQNLWEADFVSFIPGGVRIDVIEENNGAGTAVIMFFTADEVEAATIVTPNLPSTQTAIPTPGVNPNAVFSSFIHNDPANVSDSNVDNSMGIALERNGVIKQNTLMWYNRHVATNSQVASRFQNNAVLGSVFNSTYQFSYQVEVFGTGEFELDPAGGIDNNVAFFMAVEFKPTKAIDLLSVGLTNMTGIYTLNTPNIRPDSIFSIHSGIQSNNSTSGAGTFGCSMGDRDLNQASVSNSSVNNVFPTVEDKLVASNGLDHIRDDQYYYTGALIGVEPGFFEYSVTIAPSNAPRTCFFIIGDGCPDQFMFANIQNGLPSTPYEDIQPLSGMQDGENMTVESAGGDISNDNQSTWVTGPIPFVDGQSFVRAQVVSSPADGQTVFETVTVNGVSSTFSVVTVDPGDTSTVITPDVIVQDVIRPADDPIAETGVSINTTKAIKK